MDSRRLLHMSILPIMLVLLMLLLLRLMLLLWLLPIHPYLGPPLLLLLLRGISSAPAHSRRTPLDARRSRRWRTRLLLLLLWVRWRVIVPRCLRGSGAVWVYTHPRLRLLLHMRWWWCSVREVLRGRLVWGRRLRALRRRRWDRHSRWRPLALLLRGKRDCVGRPGTRGRLRRARRRPVGTIIIR